MISPTHGTEFDHVLWHDNAVYGLRLEIGDPARDDWRSNLVLDIDHIVEWLCAAGGGAQFRVAPATLTFHDVTDLQVAIDCGDSGGQLALHPISIDDITRERIVDQKVCLDRPYYRWLIAFNWPRGGQIRFGASDFTLALRAEPALQDQQQLSPLDRG